MIKLKLFIFIFIYFYSLNLYSTNVVVINIDQIINNNQSYRLIIKEIEKSQNKYLEILKQKESDLEQVLNNIENEKLFLNEEEINNKIIKYNQNVSEFSILVENFNNHYQKEISAIRSKILDKIIVLLEMHAKNNKIDLVLDSTSYLIASNAINITDIINSELDDTKLKLNYKEFDEN